MREPNGGGA
uniref:Uncharacterized protein n=1 Tax=Arundo donax TaxID=35708 RepID=A0A0A9HFF8_ARUDO